MRPVPPFLPGSLTPGPEWICIPGDSAYQWLLSYGHHLDAGRAGWEDNGGTSHLLNSWEGTLKAKP